MLLSLNVHIVRDANFIFVVTHTPYVFVTGQPQKKGISPDSEKIQIKPVKDASFIDLSPSAPPVTNVPNAVEGIPAGASLQKFWQVLAAKYSSPQVV